VTRMLASVLDATEAVLAVEAGADIVDLKDPGRGALGAVAPEALAQALAAVAGRRPVSATVGDLPMRPDLLAREAARTAAAGVDYVKLGLLPGPGLAECISALGGLAGEARLVAVLFADRWPYPGAPEALARAGFAGVMVDTADKSAGGLRRHLDEAALRAFLREAAASGLFGGLAGSLARADIPALLALGPDVLGFRGALCAGGSRTAGLDPAALRAVRAAIPAAAAGRSRPDDQPRSMARSAG